MKILFLDAINPQNELESRYPSLGLGYLSSYLKLKLGPQNIETKIIDQNLAIEIKSFQPDLVGIRAVSQNYQRAIVAAQLAKKQGLPVVMGGIHITSLPQTLTKNMDVAVLGEGEETFMKLMRLFRRTGQLKSAALSQIAGLAFWQGNRIITTPPAPLIKNLDALPFPDREILTMRPHTYLFTSRGCPFRCRFCASSRFWQTLRFFSAEYVAAEIEELVAKYQVRFISFYDDLFIADLGRVEKLLSLLQQKKLIGRVKFSCSARAELITGQAAKLLAQMGVKSVGMGLESGADEILKFLKGPSASVAKNQKAIDILHRQGILGNASFVIGSPWETQKQIRQTLEFIKHSGVDFADTYLLTPFPGTPIWDYAKKRKLVSNHMDWRLLDVNFETHPQKAIILSETLARQELWRLHRLFRQERLKIALKKIWHQPYLMDMPRFIFQKLRRCLN